MWLRMKAWYTQHAINDKLKILTCSMLKKDKDSYPKLRAGAAQARALVPFAVVLCGEMDQTNVEVAAASVAAKHLLHCYNCLGGDAAELASLKEHITKYALQLVALEAVGAPLAWRVKPKVHLWLELCQEGIDATSTWTYRDEDFGGFLAQLSKRRGGKLTVAAASSSFLRRFLMKQPVPRLV